MNKIIVFICLMVLCTASSCSKKEENEVEPLPAEPPSGTLSWLKQTPLNSISTGEVFEISGNNFSKNPADNIIKVSGVQVSHVEVITNQNTAKGTHTLRTCVPHNASSGEVTLTVGKHTIELGMLPVQTYKVTSQWTSLSDFPGTPKTDRGLTLAMNGKVYIGLGHNAIQGDSEKKFDDFWEYDPISNKWTKKSDFPGGNRAKAVAFVIGNKGYIGLGNIDTSNSGINLEKDFWEYDATTDKWTKKKDFPRGRREISFYFTIGNRGYLCFINKDSGQDVNEFWEYNPTDDSWQQKAIFPNRILNPLTSLNLGSPVSNLGTVTKGYVCLNYSEFWEYEPSQNQWKYLFKWVGEGIRQEFGFTMNNRVYIVLSYFKNAGFSYPLAYSFLEHDPTTNSQKKLPDFPGAPRNATHAFSINNVGYLGIGFYYKDLWAFRP